MKITFKRKLFSFLLVLSLIMTFLTQVTLANGETGYTVSFETNGAATVAPQDIGAGEKVAMPGVPEREGYTFTGWFTDSDCNAAYDFESSVEDSFTLYAGWETDNTYLLYRDFSKGVSAEDIADMNTLAKGTADGLVSRRGDASSGTESLKLAMTARANSATTQPTSLIYCEGGITNKQTETRNSYLPNGDLALTGNIVLEAEMKFDTLTDVAYYPLSVVGSQYLTRGAGIIYTYATRMLEIKNGKCYIAGSEKGTINANQYYKFKIVMNIDGDTSTRDKFTTTVTDGETTYTGGEDLYYNPWNGWSPANGLASIGYIHVVKPISVKADGTDVKTNVDIKTLNFYYDEEFGLSDYITAEVTCGSFTAGEDVSVKATYTNETNISLTPCFVAALYDGEDKLLDTTVVTTETVAGGGTYELETGLFLPEDAAPDAYVKVYAWTNLTSLIPMMDAIVK